MRNKKAIVCVAFLLLGLEGIHAQEIPTVGGGEFTLKGS